jgi:hypothetical protein
MLLATIVFGGFGLNVPMGIAAFVALSLLFFAHLDQFAEFKASATGISAKTKRIVRQAQDTLEELRSLATIVSKVQISLLARQGRIGGYDQKAQEALRAEIFKILDRIGVDKAEHDEILSDVHKLDQMDYVHEILGGGVVPSSLGIHLVPDGGRDRIQCLGIIETLTSSSDD